MLGATWGRNGVGLHWFGMAYDPGCPFSVFYLPDFGIDVTWWASGLILGTFICTVGADSLYAQVKGRIGGAGGLLVKVAHWTK